MTGLIRLLVAVVLFGARPVIAQAPAYRATASWVSEHAVPIRLDGDGPLPSLVPLIARARLIGVGESVHNQHEFLVLRFRLLRELVARGRVTALVLESGLPEGIGVDRYVTGQSDTIDFDAALKYGFGALREVRESVEWLRHWNLGQGRAHPVRVYGIDLPASAGSMIPALDAVVELAADDPALVAWVNTTVRPLASRVSGAFWRPALIRYDSLPLAAKDSLRSAVSELVAKTTGRPDWESRLAIVA